MVTGTLPFTARNIEELAQKQKDGKFFLPPDVKLSNYCINMIKCLIVTDPGQRI